MNWVKLDQQLTELVEKRNELSQMDYSNDQYDDLEDKLHDLEDDFNEDYEEILEPVLNKIYAKLKSDTDILLPSAYLANQYKKLQKDSNGIVSYEVEGKQGVPIESDQLGKVDLRIVLIPNPARFMLMVNGKALKELWKSR